MTKRICEKIKIKINQKKLIFFISYFRFGEEEEEENNGKSRKNERSRNEKKNAALRSG